MNSDEIQKHEENAPDAAAAQHVAPEAAAPERAAAAPEPAAPAVAHDEHAATAAEVHAAEHAPAEHAHAEHAHEAAPAEHVHEGAPEHAHDAPLAGHADEAAPTGEEPGDDVGNRAEAGASPVVDGAAPAQDGDSPSKKRRRRRKKKHAAEGAEAGAPAVEGEQAADGEDETDPETGEPRPRARGPKGGPNSVPRERPAFSIGEEVFGRVSKLTEAAVWIDIAGKAIGLLDRRELIEEIPPAEGDQFIATVASAGVRGGMLMLSRLPILLDESRKVVEAASQSGELLTGFVTGAVKGGLEVDFGGLRAFAPASHVDIRHGADLSYLVGERLDFTVTQYAKKGRDIVVSRRKMIEEDAKKARTEAMSKIEIGSTQKAIVRKVVAWGVFVALPEANNVEGLIHMTEASHDRGARLTDLFKQGEEIEVKVQRVDERGKLWLSRKAVVQDPWDAVKEKYAVGTRHKGRVARLQPFGAFIELESGVDGLIHAADLSVKPFDHPSEIVKIDEEIEVVVVSCDPTAHKIGLHPAPPEGQATEPRQRIAPHKAVKVSVAQITEGGLVVRVLGVTGRGARGFIPAGHTGTPRGTDLRKQFPLGMEFDAKVIEIDPRRGEAKLSIRALKEDGEKQAYAQYRAGVARDSKFGTFADLMKKSSST